MSAAQRQAKARLADWDKLMQRKAFATVLYNNVGSHSYIV